MTKKKITNPYIFLDIDGVLALDFEMNWLSQKKYYEKMNCYYLNKKAVKVFNEICTMCNPIIILSSDWKDHYTIEQMNEFFEWNDIITPITDYTPTLWGKRFFKLQDLEECRSTEILTYIREREIENYIAIDDLDLSPWIPDNFVRTPRSTEGIKQFGIKDKIINKLKLK